MLQCSKIDLHPFSRCPDRSRRADIPGLHDTITRLGAIRSRFPAAFQNHEVDERLREFTGFGSNPGNLIARSYLPDHVGAGSPLVVVLHGCTQSASSYNRGAGWTSAADEHGFAVLFPEQQAANNPNLCFNWFSAGDAGRGRGEALSVAQMVDDLCSRHGLDRRRVYVTGLSAGGAMTAAMLATYPDVFAGGAVIAGLPFGTATSIPQAFERMRGPSELTADQLSSCVRAASDHAGNWPTLSVWHGSSDRTVNAGNAASLVAQWRGLHGVPAAPSTTETVSGHLRRVWRDGNGVEVIEEFVIENMGHGTPLDVVPANKGEAEGPYMLDVGISSTRRIIGFWGLDQAGEPARAAAPPINAERKRSLSRIDPAPPASGSRTAWTKASPGSPPPSRTSKVQNVIEAALRNAGLMK